MFTVEPIGSGSRFNFPVLIAHIKHRSMRTRYAPDK